MLGVLYARTSIKDTGFGRQNVDLKTRTNEAEAWFTLAVAIVDFHLLTYVNECLIKQSMKRILHCFYKDIHFI